MDGTRSEPGVGNWQPQLQQVADGAWAYIQPDGSWMVNNMGLIESSRGNISVDVTSTQKRTAAYLNAAKSATGRDIQYLIYTHSHPDHCNGASLVPDAKVIAHQKAKEELRATLAVAEHIFTPFDMGAVHPVEPDITYTDSLTLYADAREVQIIHPGTSAHTGGDSYVWLPDSRVLFAGDLVFNGGTPFLLSGSLTGWLKTLEDLKAHRPRTIVPGHGPIGGPELLDSVVDYLLFLRGTAVDALAAGLEPLEAARRVDLGRYAGLSDAERIVGNLHRAYAEISGWQVNHDVVFQEMFEYNGARPLTCHA